MAYPPLMCPSHVEVTSITSNGEASEQRSFIPSYHTTVLAIMNREQRAKRRAEYVPRPTEQHHHLINREQREKTYRVRLNETWRLIHNVVRVEKGL